MPEGITNLRKIGQTYRLRANLTPRTEKVLHQGSAFVPEDSSGQLCFGMEGPAVDCGVRAAAPIAVLVVFRAEYDAADLAPVERAGTHQTGFYGDIDGGFGKVFAAEIIEGGGERNDLGVGGTVVEAFGLVMTAGDDAVVHHNYGADRHFFLFICETGLFERLLHVVFVGHGEKGKDS